MFIIAMSWQWHTITFTQYTTSSYPLASLRYRAWRDSSALYVQCKGTVVRYIDQSRQPNSNKRHQLCFYNPYMAIKIIKPYQKSGYPNDISLCCAILINKPYIQCCKKWHNIIYICTVLITLGLISLSEYYIELSHYAS